MLVVGYKAGANFTQAHSVIKKHTSFSINEIKQLCDAIREGQSVRLPDDFVLREDLEDLQFILS